MPIKAILFDMFDTLMLIEKNHEFYSPSLMRMYKYLNKNGIDVSFDKFNAAYIKARDALYAKADLNFEEPHFNVRISKALKSLGYNYDDSSPFGDSGDERVLRGIHEIRSYRRKRKSSCLKSCMENTS